MCIYSPIPGTESKSIRVERGMSKLDQVGARSVGEVEVADPGRVGGIKGKWGDYGVEGEGRVAYCRVGGLRS